MQNASSQLSTRSPSVKIIIHELKRKKLAIVLVILSMLAGSGVWLIQPLFYKSLLDTAIPTRDTTRIAWLITGMVATPLVGIGLGYLQHYYRTYLGEHVSQILRQSLFEHLIHVRIIEFEKKTSGELMHRITREAGKVGEVYIKDQLIPIVSNTILFVGTLTIMCALNLKLALISSIALPGTYFCVKYLMRHSRTLDKRFSDLLEFGQGYLLEVFRGIRMIRSFNGETREKDRWAQWIREHIRQKLKSSAFHDVLLTFPNDVVNNLVIGLLFGYGAYEIINGNLTIGSLVAFVAYAPRAYAALRAILETYIGTQRVSVSIEKLDELYRLPLESVATPGLLALPLDPDDAPEIEFRNVSFLYDRGFGVKDLTFSIKSGEFIGIVGPTGGGKSTIIDLLLRFHDPESGQIIIDGIDTKNLSLISLRSKIALVPQDVFLWNASIRENIIYPAEKAEEQVVQLAVTQAQIDDFIRAQPEGLKTLVGESGRALSGGERQRIAIARALIKQPAILLMDEATSALDALTEAKVRDILDHIRVGRSVVVVAHRLSTVLHADRILVIGKEGLLVESGAPQDLLNQGGLFADLYRAQALDLDEPKGNIS